VIINLNPHPALHQNEHYVSPCQLTDLRSHKV